MSAQRGKRGRELVNLNMERPVGRPGEGEGPPLPRKCRQGSRMEGRVREVRRRRPFEVKGCFRDRRDFELCSRGSRNPGGRRGSGGGVQSWTLRAGRKGGRRAGLRGGVRLRVCTGSCGRGGCGGAEGPPPHAARGASGAGGGCSVFTSSQPRASNPGWPLRPLVQASRGLTLRGDLRISFFLSFFLFF